MKSNDPVFDVDITAVAYGGDGICRLPDGVICFVPRTVPGDRVRIRLTAKQRRFCRGRVVEVLSASPARIVPECPYFSAADKIRCPGCCAQMMDYESELYWKSRQFADFLLRKELCDSADIAPIFPSPRRYGVRNKLKLHAVPGAGYGYVGSDNRTVLPVSHCLLAAPEINVALAALPPDGGGETVTLRCTAEDGVVSFRGKNDAAGRMLSETLEGFGKFTVPAAGFFQTNIPVAAKLVGECTDIIAASGCRELVELYCGVGVFSIAAAEKIPGLRCHGVEISAAAIGCAVANAAAHKVESRCTFTAGDAATGISGKASLNGRILLIDPPRSGVAADTLDAIIAAAPELLIYISCAPDTLQRDLVRICDGGYKVRYARAFDMFPGTGHFESLTVLEQKKL